ncbi:hypothetical protein IL306_007808 [Fusarium sp. DS 682]|nr:hypothetical protein IL306_007808 [Fusarium sp. DS 682]
MDVELFSRLLLTTSICEKHVRLVPNTADLRPYLPIPTSELQAIIKELKNRGELTHFEWEKSITKLEQLMDDYPEPDTFDVLNILEDAFFNHAHDCNTIAYLSRDAQEDASVLLYPAMDAPCTMARIIGVDVSDPDSPGEDWWKDHGKEAVTDELMHWVIDCFHSELVKANEILFGNAVDANGQPIERYRGAEKLHEFVIPRLPNFIAMQRNTPISIHILRRLFRLHNFVKATGHAKWLYPLEASIVDSPWWNALKHFEGQEDLLGMKEGEDK